MSSELAIPNDPLVYGAVIDRDFSITPWTRRDWIRRGLLPPPDVFVNGRGAWKASTYLRAKEQILARGTRRLLPQERAS